MQYVSLHGEKVPALGLGTWELTGRDCRRAVVDAVDLGYRHVDTAQAYGNEDLVGQALAAAGVDRGELFVTTKLWNRHHAGDTVRRSTEDSLRRLRTDFVDLLLVHWPVEFGRLAETLTAMVALVDEGKVRHVGVSNFTAAQFRQARALAPVVTNQVEYHPFLSQRRVLEAARRHGATVTAYSPLARGAVFDEPVLAAIGRRHGRSPAQVSLRWLLHQDDVLAVPKATSREHLAANLAVFDFSLTDDERARIDGLARGLRLVDPPWAPDWDA